MNKEAELGHSRLRILSTPRIALFVREVPVC